MRFPAADLSDFATRCFEAADVPTGEAREIADNLVLADLRGIASHGITRVPIYAERLRRRAVNPRPDMRLLTDTGALKLLDGDNGSGAVVSNHANRIAIRAAKENGTAVVIVRNSNHHGIAAAYTMKAAKAGLIGVTATNVSKSMAVAGSREPVVGTNPISFAVPRKGQAPIVLDMATSVVARGKVVEASKRGEPIPAGWALDSEGRPTTDSVAAEKGVILPFAGAKGSGLSIMIDMLTGVLGGGLFGALIPNLYSNFSDPQRIGHFFLAIDPAALDGGDGFDERVEQFAALIKSAKKADGVDEIMLPGEPEARLEARLLVEGIALPRNVIVELDALAAELGVPSLSGGRIDKGDGDAGF